MRIYIGPIGGSFTEITNYLSLDGVKWATEALIVPGNGNNLNGDTMRKVTKWKDVLRFICRAITVQERNTLVSILKADYLKVRLTDDFGTALEEYECLTDSIGDANLTKSGLLFGMSFDLEMK